MKKIMRWLITLMIMCSMLSTIALADDMNETKDTASNLFVTGGEVLVGDREFLDGFIAGNTVSVVGNYSEGSIFAAGNTLNLEGDDTFGSVFAGGNIVTINKINSSANIYVAGSAVSISDSVAKGLYIGGQSIDVEGDYDYVFISGENVVFNGYVDGDAVIEGKKVVLGDYATVNGKLTIKSENEPEISEEAEVPNCNYVKTNSDGVSNSDSSDNIGSKIVDVVKKRLYYIVAMGIVGLILCLLFGKQLDDSAQMVKSKTGPMLGTGAVSYFAIPMACIIVAITVIGLPLAGFALMAYIFAILIGSSFAGASLGRLVLPKINKLLASLIGIAVLVIIDIIPIVGIIVSMLADMYFMGYIGQKIYVNMKKEL